MFMYHYCYYYIIFYVATIATMRRMLYSYIYNVYIPLRYIIYVYYDNQ